MGVVPQEGKEGSNNRKTEAQKEDLALQHGDDAEGRERGCRDQSSQPIQSICQIHGIACPDNNEHGDRHVPDAKRNDFGIVGHKQIGGLQPILKDKGRAERDQYLPQEFPARSKPQARGPPANAQEIVGGPQNCIDDHHQ